jgi:hypothetical protein
VADGDQRLGVAEIVLAHVDPVEPAFLLHRRDIAKALVLGEGGETVPFVPREVAGRGLVDDDGEAFGQVLGIQGGQVADPTVDGEHVPSAVTTSNR